MPAIESLEDFKVVPRDFRSVFLAVTPYALRFTIYVKKGEGGQDFWKEK